MSSLTLYNFLLNEVTIFKCHTWNKSKFTISHGEENDDVKKQTVNTSVTVEPPSHREEGGREGWREKGWWCKNRICCTTASQDAIWQRCPEWGWVSLLMKPNDSVRDERGRQGKYNCEGEALAQLQGVRCGERKGCTGKYDTQHPALHHVQYVHCHCAAEPRKWLQWKNLQQLAHIFPACTHPRDQREMYF